MNNKDKIQLFENTPVRHEWDADREEWLFSVVDVVAVLTEQADYNTARKYWNKLKQRLTEEGSELVTKCHQLKMTAKDGKKRLTDVMTTEQVLRLVQSIPSKKAEPFKLWLAKAESPQGFLENQKIARRGGKIAGNARAEIEVETGRKVISSHSAPELEP